MNMKKWIAALTVLAMLFSMAVTVFADIEEDTTLEEENEEPTMYELTFGEESVSSEEEKGKLMDGAVEYTFADGTFSLNVKKDVELEAPIETTAALVIRTQKGTLSVTSNDSYAIKAARVSFIQSSKITLIALEKAVEAEDGVYVGATSGADDDGEEVSEALEGNNYFSYSGKTWTADTVMVLDMLLGDRRIFAVGAEEENVTLTIDGEATLTYRVGEETLKKAVLTLNKAEISHVLVNTTGIGMPFESLTIMVKRDSQVIAKDEEAAIVVKDADVLIKGTGTLTVKGQAGGLAIEGGLLTISSNLDVILSKGIASPEAVSAEALVIEGGVVYVDASQPEDGIAVKTEGNVDIYEEVEHFTAAGLSGALLSGGAVTVAEKQIEEDLTQETYVEYPVKKALAHHTMEKYDVTVAGVDITEINQADVLRNERISYKDTSSSLYLTGVTLTKAGIVVNGGNGGVPVESVTIRLSGDNEIDLEEEEGETAIYASGADVYIKGDGTLALTTVGTSIVIEDGYMRFAGGDTTLKTTGSEGTVHAEKGIKLTDTEISKGGSVKSYGDYYGIGTTKKEAAEVRVKAAEKSSSSGSSGKSSSSSGSSEKIVLTTYKVTFISFGQVVETKTIAAGDKVTPPSITLDGYTLDGWYTSEIGTEKMNFSQSVPRTMTLYARWSPVEKEEKKKEILLTIDSRQASVSGETMALDTAAFIEQSRTYTPARFVAEALGATVAWDEETRRVTITLDDITILLTIDSTVALVNGEEFALDAPAIIRNSRTFTPARFVAEALGAAVTWDEASRKVSITK